MGTAVSEDANVPNEEKTKSMDGRDQQTGEHLNPDEQFFLDHKRELLKRYDGRFVAIRHSKVVADAPTRRELEEILSQKHEEPVYTMVRRVDEEAFHIRPEDPVLI